MRTYNPYTTYGVGLLIERIDNSIVKLTYKRNGCIGYNAEKQIVFKQYKFDNSIYNEYYEYDSKNRIEYTLTIVDSDFTKVTEKYIIRNKYSDCIYKTIFARLYSDGFCEEIHSYTYKGKTHRKIIEYERDQCQFGYGF